MQKLNELQLAKELIRFPSITPVDAGVMKFLEKKLKKLGFKTKILEFKERGFQPVKNLYARLGSKKPNFMFAGHVDIVPPGNIKDWTVNPFKPSIKKGHLIGRGANDMKSSVAAFVSAVSTFLSKNRKFNGSISLLITGDEEGDAVNGTKKVVDYLKKRKEKINFCLVGEPTSKNEVGDKVKIGRRGSVSFFFQVKGIQGHTANSHLAENSSHHLVNLLNSILEEPLDEGNENFLPTSVQIATIDIGNPVQNVIPELAKATVNIRFNDMHSSDSLIKWIDNKIEKIFSKLENASCTYTYDATAESFLNKAGDLYNIISKSISDVTGRNSPPEQATDGGTSDARYIKNYCEVVELGLRNQTLHKVDEFVFVEDIIKLESIYFRILENYFDVN